MQTPGYSIDSATGESIPNKSTGGVTHVSDVGIPSQKHNRYRSGITATWPGNDTFSVTFTADENVRRYRVLPLRTAYNRWVTATAYAVGAIVHPTAANDRLVFEVTAIAGTGTSGGAEPTWPDVVGETVVDNAGANQITWTARDPKAVFVKSTEDAVNEAQAESWLANPSSSGSLDVEHIRLQDGVWSEWQELSKDSNDVSLSRLDFLANADIWEIFVEAQ